MFILSGTKIIRTFSLIKETRFILSLVVIGLLSLSSFQTKKSFFDLKKNEKISQIKMDLDKKVQDFKLEKPTNFSFIITD